MHECGKGHVLIERCHPAFFTRSPENADRWCGLVRQACEATGREYREHNYLRLRRGPYVIASALDESVDEEPLRLDGHYVDLLDPLLAVRRNVLLPPGKQAWLLDLARVRGPLPLLLAAAGRVDSWDVTDGQLQYTISSPEAVVTSTRILLKAAPKSVSVDGSPCRDVTWDDDSHTVLIRHPGHPAPVTVRLILSEEDSVSTAKADKP
jgi:hypothetical protein